MKRKLGYFLSVLLTVLLLMWLGSTASLRWYTQTIETLSDGMVRIDNLQGHPFWALQADKITVTDVDMIVSIYQPHVRWHLWQLLMGRVHIDKARVSLLDIEMLDIDTPTTFSLTDLNFLRFFEAEDLEVKQLTYRDGAMHMTVDQLHAVDLSFGRTISGHVFGQYNDRHLQLHLEGGHQQWLSELYVLHEQESELFMTLRGFAWEQGQLHIRGVHDLDVDGRWSHQGDQWLLESEVSSQYQQDTATLHWILKANPVIDDYQLDAYGVLAANVLTEDGWPFRLHARWYDQIHRARLTDQNQAGNWLQVDFDQSILHINLHTEKWQVPLQDSDAWLSSDALLQYDVTQGEWQASFHVHDSEMAALPLQFQGEVAGKGLNWEIKALTAKVLGLNLRMQGQQKDDVLALNIDVDSQQLKEVFAFAGMHADAKLQANIVLQGRMQQPLLHWHVQLDAIHSEVLDVESLSLKGQADPLSWLAKLNVQAKNVQVNQQDIWHNLELLVEKTAEEIRVTSQASGDVALRLSLQGQHEKDAWSGQLQQLFLQYQGQDILYVKPSDWQWKQGTLVMKKGQLLLQQQPGEWQLSADHLGSNFQLHLERLNLSAMSHWLPDWVLSGKPTSLQLSLQGLWSKPKLSLLLKSQQWLLYDQKNKRKFHVAEPHLQLNYNNGFWSWQADAQMHRGDTLALQGQLAWQLSLYPWLNEKSVLADMDQTHVRIQLHDLNAWRSLFLPTQEDMYLEGQASAKIQLDNVLQSVSVQGQVSASLSHIQVPELGVDLQATLQAFWHKKQGNVDLVFAGKTGEARLKASVVWPWQQSTVSLQLIDFPLLNTDDHTVKAEGTLSLSLDEKKQLSIAGKLLAKHMIIGFPDRLPQASQDIVWQDELQTADVEHAFVSGRLDIQIVLADDAQIVGDGMQMKLQGSLHLGGTLDQPTLTGDILVHDGFFVFRHVKLQVQPNSHIIFTGDLSQPTLNIRVARKQEDMLLGVHISGVVDAMQSVFYSDPAMNQAEILAYMATGKSLGNLDGNDLSVAANVASFFLTSDGSVLTKVHDVLQKTFGLDSLNWEVTPSGGRVIAGKRLNKKVNVQLEQSLQAQASTALTLEYLLARGLAVFARQMSNQAPLFGLRYRKVWNGTKANKTATQP